MLRNLLAVIAGIIGGTTTISLVELAGSKLYPVPAAVDLHNAEAVKIFMQQIPVGALLLVAAGWLLGAFAGSVIATLLTKTDKTYCGYIVGAVLLASAIANLFMLPHPGWFWAIGIATIALGTWLGVLLSASKQTP